MSDALRPAPSIRPYLFFDERRPKRAWMPALEGINGRFAQYCRATLLQYLQPPVEVTAQFAIEVIRHGELIDRLPVPSHLTLVALKPLEGTALIAIEPALVGIIVESRFGGSGRMPVVAVPDREFAPIEQQAMSRIVERLLDQWAAAWKPIATVMPQVVRHEVKPAFATIGGSTEFVIVNSFDVTVARGSGKLLIAIPYEMLRPLNDSLVTLGPERVVSRDARWSQELQIGIGSAAMEVAVEFAAIEVTVRDFLSLQPGSVFEIARPDTVTVQSGGKPLFGGRWGRHGRKIAVRVERQLRPTPTGPAAAAAQIDKGGDDAG
ncbi:MAG TPA: FliM/FliN family flagellar motor switch protein [Stellaceae bacterium]|nr:FliM/FliN family flagellar motor switch protein [Stellaceae bacterium]